MIRIAVCAPSTPFTRDDAERVRAIAARHDGIEVHFHEQCFSSFGHFAGPDEERLSAFVECANDPAVDAVWFARGGYGANRIAARAMTQLREASFDKAYFGYSDGGYLLSALYARGIGHPVHAPMPVDIRRHGGEAAIDRLLGFVVGERSGIESTLDGRPAAAFNLMTLAMVLGTELAPDLTGHVVMVEEVSEHLYAIDRLFFHVTSQLAGIAGLRLGRVSDIPENDRPFGMEVEEIAQYWCERSGIPYLGRADIGHDSSNRIVPFGLVRG